MSTEQHHITVGGVKVEIVRKAIKNLHLGVYPPSGRVRVAAPLAVSDEAVRLAVVRRLGWIKRQRAQFDSQPRQSEREFVSGESHYFLGRRYRLRVIAHEGAGRVVLRNRRTIELHVRSGSEVVDRERVMQRWYRERMRELVPPLVAKWQEALGVQLATWGIRRMKTKWGTCSGEKRRMTLNLELAKKPVACLEYLVAHELTHLRERHHDARFVALLDQQLPHWRRIRDDLNAAPLAHAAWED